MDNRKALLTKLREIMTNNLEVKAPEQLQETDRLSEDLNIDSIMFLQLVVYIEEAFDLSVPEDDVDPSVFQTVGSLVTFIQTLQGMKV